MHIPANTLKEKNDPVDLFLTDYLQIAFGLREEFDKHVQSYESYVKDYEKAPRRYLAGLVCAVAKSKPRLKDWIDYDSVVKEQQDNDRETAERLRGKTTAEAHLRDWKLGAGFQITREDYTGTQDIEEAILAIDTCLTTVDEVKYLTARYQNYCIIRNKT